jgi:8-oxo-dGTP pyrophosphatase MutT (NUDIX family)
LDTAKRELKEETGLIAQEWKLISKLHTSNSVCNEVAFIFLAERMTQSESQPEETEQLQVKKISLNEALMMVLDNKITDSMSVAGILKVARLKGL